MRETGLLQRTPWFYTFVAVILALGFGGAITGFILLGDTWYQLLIAAAFGILFTQVAFLSHEAAHRTILTSGPANDRLGLILGNGIVGMSRSWWTSKHTRHHANPNRVGKDPDIEIDTISFLDEDAAKATGMLKFITRRQGWLFFPLLTLEGINLHFIGLKHLLDFRQEVKGRWVELGLISLRFALVLTPIFLFLPLGMAFAFLGVQLAVFGVYMGAAFAPNHKGMPIVHPDAKLDFFTKQVRWMGGDVAHGRSQLPDRAPPFPEHAAASSGPGAQHRARVLQVAGRAVRRNHPVALLRHRHRLPEPGGPGSGRRSVRLPRRRNPPPGLTARRSSG